MQHQGTVALESERLLLRRFTMADADAMFANWASDEQVTRYLAWPTHESVEVTKSVLRTWSAGYDRPDFYQWAIVPKALGEPIGTISAVRLDEQAEKVEIGYCIGRKWWHQGFTSEALSTVLPFFFAQVGAGRVEARHDIDNLHSGGVMRKCGLRCEGTLRKAGRNNRGIVDVCVYGILATDDAQ